MAKSALRVLPALALTAVLVSSANGDTGICNPVTSVAACQGEKVGTDAAAPFCGGGQVCEFMGPAQRCVCTAAVPDCPPDDVNECCVNDGTGAFADAANQLVTINGGQVSGAGATLLIDFFRSPSSTLDWVEVDGDGCSGFMDPVPAGCPVVDQLATGYTVGLPLTTWWNFQYRSVGSVNGFNEFVGNQLCGTFVRTVPSEAGIFNRFEYATAGTSNNGAGANGTGTPLEPCEINISFLDVPSSWGVQQGAVAGTCFIKCLGDPDCPSGQTCVGGACDPPAACTNDEDCIIDGIVGKCRGGAKWDAQPNQPGYGLNFILSSTGFASNLQTLSRQCGACSLGGNLCDLNSNCNGTQRCVNGACSISSLACAGDGDCPLITGQTCVGAGPVVSLNGDVINPDNDTIFDTVVAVVPVALIANRGTGVENVKYSEMQYLFVTGRMPNGENLVGATRSVGSGTRNAIMNSMGIDTSWGRGDNVGPEYIPTATSNVGPGHQATNGQGSSQLENAVEHRRLAIGTTGLGGPSRAIADASQAGGARYEILNLCKDVDTNGNPLCNCNVPNPCPARRFCSITPVKCAVDTDCPAGETCIGKITDAAAPNNGYVRPDTNTVLDNCDECCGYTIVGNGSFVTRGNPNQTDPAEPDYMNDGAVRDYIRNISDSVNSFSGVQPNICLYAEVCSIRECDNAAGMACASDADCPGMVANSCDLVDCISDADCVANGAGGACTVPKPCTTNAQCTGVPRRCDNAEMTCTMDMDCPPGGTCLTDACLNQLNMPGQFMAVTFTLPAGVDCTQSFDDGMVFSPTPGLNQTLQDFQRDPSSAGVPPAFQTPGFGSAFPNSGGRVPGRKTGFTYSDGQSAGSVGYIYYSGGGNYTLNLAGGQRLAKRNRIQGDFNEDCARDVNDAGQLVSSVYTPRAWQQTAPAINTGLPSCYGAPSAESQSTGGIDGAVPEVIGDFDGDGSLTKEDLRYFMDGLALRRKRCCTISLDKCVVNADCPDGEICDPCDLCSETKVKCHMDADCPGGATDLCELAAFKLNRKDGAIAIDNAIDALPGNPNYPWAEGEPMRCSVANQLCYEDGDCPGGEMCNRTIPNGDLNRYLVRGGCCNLTQATRCSSNLDCPAGETCGQCSMVGPANDPLFLSLTPITEFLSTGAAYQPGDFRGDVAGGRAQKCISSRCSITGFPCAVDADCPAMAPNAGGDPIGWDGKVDAADVEYCCAQTRVGDWSELNDAVFIDLSCDMDGDLDVDGNDVRELVEVILKAPAGDFNLDGVVNEDDRAFMLLVLKGSGACAGSAGADLNYDGVVDFCDWFLSGSYGDVSPAPTGDGFVDVGDILCVLDGFGGLEPCFNFTDIFPCPAGDGFVDVGDILAILDAFAGFPVNCCVP